MDVAIPNSHNFYSTIIETFLKYTGINEELRRIWQLNAVCIVPLVVFTIANVSKS